MRLGWLILLLLLAHLSALAFRPLLGGGADAVDPVLLLLIWFALVDSMSEIHVYLSRHVEFMGFDCTKL